MFVVFRRLFYSVVVLGCLILIGLGFLWKNFTDTPLIVGKNEIIYVPPGSSISSVAKTLETKGILKHPELFIILAKIEGKQKELKAGEYLVDSGITPKQLLTKFVQGKVIMRQFTIVEGWTLKQVFSSINANPYLAHTLTSLSPLDFSKKMGSTSDNYEGRFYPDTYLFAAGVPDVVILKKAFWAMEKSLEDLWKNRAADLPYDDSYSALIVASLIERETARGEERAKVAGVIVRRLKKNMLLQIDASVIYGLGDEYNGKLTRADLKKDTPFNTYMHAGLPPTPIAMPSLPSIYAALHPEPGDALYYVAKGDGTHEFTSTLEQHHEAVKKYHVEHLEPTKSDSQPDSLIPWFNNPSPQQLNQLFGFE